MVLIHDPIYKVFPEEEAEDSSEDDDYLLSHSPVKVFRRDWWGAEEVYDFNHVPVQGDQFVCCINFCDDSQGSVIPTPKFLLEHPPSVLIGDKRKLDFLVLMDDESCFTEATLNMGGLHNLRPCMVVKGTLDASTCYFLRFVKKRLPHIEILAFIDYDPTKLKLLSFYETWDDDGRMPYDLTSVRLDIKWLGIRPKLEELREYIFVEMGDERRAAASEMLNKPFVKDHPARAEELQNMLSNGWWFPIGLMPDDFRPPRILLRLLDDQDWI